jgi:hypothetical protein
MKNGSSSRGHDMKKRAFATALALRLLRRLRHRHQ